MCVCVCVRVSVYIKRAVMEEARHECGAVSGQVDIVETRKRVERVHTTTHITRTNHKETEKRRK